MTDQLVLIEIAANTTDARQPWQLSPALCEIGLQGVLMARQALKRSRIGYVDISENCENT